MFHLLNIIIYTLLLIFHILYKFYISFIYLQYSKYIFRTYKVSVPLDINRRLAGMRYRTTCLFTHQLKQIKLSMIHAQVPKKKIKLIFTVDHYDLQQVATCKGFEFYHSIDRLIVATSEFNFMRWKQYFCNDKNCGRYWLILFQKKRNIIWNIRNVIVFTTCK